MKKILIIIFILITSLVYSQRIGMSLDSFAVNITNTGNVGIGTTTPTSKLEVTDGYNGHSGSEPLVYFRTAINDKIAVLGSAETGISPIFPAYNIGLYGTAKGGTNNFAGYFNFGDVYVHENLGIGTTTPAAALHIKDGSERLGVVTYSTLDSTHLSTQDVRCTDTIKTSGTFYYGNGGNTFLSINSAYSIQAYGFSTIHKDSSAIQHFGTTLSDDEVYGLMGGLGTPITGTITVDSASKKLFTVEFVADGDGTVYLGDVKFKRWTSITYVDDDSATDNMFDIYDNGNGVSIKNRLGYTIKAVIHIEAFQY